MVGLTKVLTVVVASAVLAPPVSVEAGSNVMPHNISVLPPFDSKGESLYDDPVIMERYQIAIRNILKKEEGIVTTARLTLSDSFGPVFRADFVTQDDIGNQVNRIMLWQLPDGKIAEFTGFNVPTNPLNY